MENFCLGLRATLFLTIKAPWKNLLLLCLSMRDFLLDLDVGKMLNGWSLIDLSLNWQAAGVTCESLFWDKKANLSENAGKVDKMVLVFSFFLVKKDDNVNLPTRPRKKDLIFPFFKKGLNLSPWSVTLFLSPRGRLVIIWLRSLFEESKGSPPSLRTAWRLIFLLRTEIDFRLRHLFIRLKR